MKLNDMNITGSQAMTVRPQEQGVSILAKLQNSYDEHAKLVFMFDVSGSMCNTISASYTDQYLWPPEVMARVQTRIAEVLRKVNALQKADPLSVLLGLSKVDDLTDEAGLFSKGMII